MNKIRINKISELLKQALTPGLIHKYWLIATAGIDATRVIPYREPTQEQRDRAEARREADIYQAQLRRQEAIRAKEEGLRGHGIIPIKYIGGVNATEGHHIKSKYGDIFEVLYQNGPSIAKIVDTTDPEPAVWRKIKNSNISANAKRHLPEIKAIIDMNKVSSESRAGRSHSLLGTVIIMEKLGPYSAEINNLLRGRSDKTSDKKKDEEFIHKALIRAMGDALVSVVKSASETEEEQDGIASFLKFATKVSFVTTNLESDIFKGVISIEDVHSESELISNNIRASFSDFYGSKDLVEIFIKHYIISLNKYFSSPKRPLPKYNKPRDGVFPPRESYDGQEEGFLYFEEYAPETRSLFSAIMELKSAGILWNDLHANNIMQRIEKNSHGDIGDLVVIDVGQYEIE